MGALELTTRQGWEDRGALVSLGRRWLVAAGSSHGAYAGVLLRLIEALPDNSDLLQRGWKWISFSDFANPSWTWFWCAVERATRGVQWPHRKVLLELGVKWLN